MSERTLVFIDLLGDEELPDNAEQLVTFIQGRLAAVPPEWRSSVVLTHELNHGFEAGDTSISITFGYDRLETDEEMAARVEREWADRETCRRGAEEMRRRQYEALRLEFEGPITYPPRQP